MAHGKTLELRKATRPEPEYVKRYVVEQQDDKTLAKVGDWSPHTNPERDRSLAGKARRLARKAARKAVA